MKALMLGRFKLDNDLQTITGSSDCMSGGWARMISQLLPFMEFFAELTSESSCLILN